MEEVEMRNAVLDMNQMLTDDMALLHSFWFQSNDFVDAVLFDDVVLWDSENDNREWIGPEGCEIKEPLLDYLKREFDKYVEDLVSVSMAQKIKPELQSIYKDIEMLRDGQWHPNEDSCNDSLTIIEKIANILKIDLT